MAKVKIGLQNLSIPQKIQKVNLIIQKMTGNPDFPTPNPSLADMTTKKTNLENALSAAESLRLASLAQTLVLNSMEDEIDLAINLEGAYVENASGGDAGKIIGSGYETADTTPGIVPLYVPEGFTATTGDEEGEINCMWNKLKNVGEHSYIVKGRKYGTADAFAQLAGTDQSKVDIKNLEPGSKYEVYVYAVKKNEPGPQSETVVAKAG